MPSLCGVQVGIDTGCLFTEVVIADQTGVLAWSVHPTSYDIQTGLTRALTDALEVGKETTGNKICLISLYQFRLSIGVCSMSEVNSMLKILLLFSLLHITFQDQM